MSIEDEDAAAIADYRAWLRRIWKERAKPEAEGVWRDVQMIRRMKEVGS